MVSWLNLIDFTDCELSRLQYGGAAGRKLGIIYNGSRWMLKFPDNLRERDLKNVEISYGNNPISEHIGSLVFKALGIPVHETLLGLYSGKLVVACKDFTSPTSRLVEFREFKVSYLSDYTDYRGNTTNGTSVELSEVLDCINKHPILSTLDVVKQRFWDMFVVDALNGNPDRNNGNWGCLLDTVTLEYSLAPVYDNGNCLNFRLSEGQMQEALNSNVAFSQLAVNGVICRFTDKGHKVNPFTFIKENHEHNRYLNSSLQRVVSYLTLELLTSIVCSVIDVGDIRCRFITELYSRRLGFLRSLSSYQGRDSASDTGLLRSLDLDD